MKIVGKIINLRSFQESDIEDYIRWFTLETEWLNWDAPWEDYSDFDTEQYRNLQLQRLKDPEEPAFHHRLEIENKDLEHVGLVGSYYIDRNYNLGNSQDYLTIGIDIPPINQRGKGYATEAWILYITYIFEQGHAEVYTQTWEGNARVMGLMKKLGFELVNVAESKYIVQGTPVDYYSYKLIKKKFEQFTSEYLN